MFEQQLDVRAENIIYATKKISLVTGTFLLEMFSAKSMSWMEIIDLHYRHKSITPTSTIKNVLTSIFL